MLVVGANIGQEVLAEFFRLLNLSGLRASHVEVHRFIGLLPCAVFHETTSTSFDLNSTTCFLLNVFDVSTSLTDYLRTKVETRNVFHVKWDALLRPFPLQKVSLLDQPRRMQTLPFQTHLVRPVRVPSVESVSRRQD